MKQNVFENEASCFRNSKESCSEWNAHKAWDAGIAIFTAALEQKYREVSTEQLGSFIKAALGSLDERDLVNLLPGSRMPRDARVDIVYRPSYAVIAAAVYLKNTLGEDGTKWMNDRLRKLMDAAFCYGIVGHGFETGQMRRQTMLLLCRAGVKRYLEGGHIHSEIFRKYVTEEIEKIRTMAENRDHTYRSPGFDDDGFDKEPFLTSILAAYEEKPHAVFVYGTLMRGQHASEMLRDAFFVSDAVLNNYAMYDLGNYPGIKPREDGVVPGEVYFVDDETLKKLDRYEGEGSLYHRERVSVFLPDIGKTTAFAYIYAHPVSGKPQEVRWGTCDSDEIWYAAYGSNIDKERFSCYIEGGYCHQNGKHYTGCADKTPWKDDMSGSVCGRMYFGNSSGSWSGGGVAFYHPESQGVTSMHLYRITYGQLKDIQRQEGMSPNWYGRTVFLTYVQGLPVYTFTSESVRPQNEPSEAYLSLIKTALVRENGMTETGAEEYLQSCLIRLEKAGQEV